MAKKQNKKNEFLYLEDIQTTQDISEIASNPLHLITCLQNKQLINTKQLCSSCELPMALVLRKNTKGQYGFLCKKCHTVSPLSRGTFFEKNRMSYEGVLLTLFSWACHVKAQSTASLYGITLAKVLKQYQCFRQICTMKLSKDPIKIGGFEDIVEIKENLCTIPAKEESHKEIQQWIVGMYSHHGHAGFVTIVNNKRGDTILDLIKKHVVPATTVWTNDILNLPKLSIYGYSHATFQQSAGAHIEFLHQYWASVKNYLRSNCRIKVHQINEDYLNEYLWMAKYGRTPTEAFHNMLNHISECYPANQKKTTDIIANESDMSG